jgi:hypothetical protein
MFNTTKLVASPNIVVSQIKKGNITTGTCRATSSDDSRCRKPVSFPAERPIRAHDGEFSNQSLGPFHEFTFIVIITCGMAITET